MVNRFKPISISLSPNVQRDDVVLAWKLALQPWKWAGRKSAPAVMQLESEFKKYLGVKYAVSFNSGRSALYAILKALNLPQESEVLLQAFTCNAVPNPVLWAKLKPLYIDCNKSTFNIDIEKLRRQDLRRRALIVQHTFGFPANMAEIMDIVRQNDMTLIEDCAHALGAAFHNQKLGTFGKAAFYSFSRDKVISSVYGGLAVTNDDELGKRLEALQKEFGLPSYTWIRQQLLHPILLKHIILPLYKFFDLGKLFLIASQWLHVLSKAVSWQEKRGLKPDYFPKALPNALATMALHQFKKLDTFYSHRRKLAEFYYQELRDSAFIMPHMDSNQSFLRFVVKHPKAHDIIYDAWNNHNILLGDWYTTVIAPFDTKLEDVKYTKGTCPDAESLAKVTLNLPTHINISMEDAKRVVEFLKKYK